MKSNTTARGDYLKGQAASEDSDTLSASSIGDRLAEAAIRRIQLGAGVRRQD